MSSSFAGIIPGNGVVPGLGKVNSAAINREATAGRARQAFHDAVATIAPIWPTHTYG